MKQIFSLFLLAFSVGAFAQVLPQSQCPSSGVMLSRDYAGIVGESVAAKYQRSGTDEISTEAEFVGSLKARTFKAYTERYCVAQVYSYQAEACVDIPADRALGRGNNSFQALFDLNQSLLRRAEHFTRAVRYNVNAPQATRLATANEVVKHLTRHASSLGVPRSWEAFQGMLRMIVTEGFMTQAEFDDIATINAAVNRRELGFEPMGGLRANEGRGNGKLQKMFDLTLTQQHRAAFIRTNLDGLNAETSMNLAKSAIEFASVSGVPATWNQLLLMLRDAVVKNAISEMDFRNITETFEQANRARLGFEVAYFSCRMENRQHNYNAIDTRQVNEYNSEVSQKYKISITKAPLLTGEDETHSISFHSLNGLSFDFDTSFNTYTAASTVAADLITVSAVGERKRIKPSNTIKTKVHHKGKYINVDLQNTGFKPNIGGRVLVEVHFYEKVAIVSDKKLGEREFELTNGDMTAFTPNVKMIKASRPAYVKVFMKIIGSPYYSEEQTGFFKVEE